MSCICFNLGRGGQEANNNPLSLLFDLDDKVDTVYNTISLLRTAREEDDDDQELDKEEQQQKQQQPELVMNQKTLCNSCESPNDIEARFCSKCGNKLVVVEDVDEDPTTTPSKPLLENYSIEKEKAFFRSEG